MKGLKRAKLQRELKKYRKKEVMKNKRTKVERKFILWIVLLAIILFYGYYTDFSITSMIFILIFLLLLGITFLFVGNYNLKKELLLQEKSQNIRDSKIYRKLENNIELEKRKITHIILKNEENYDVKTWALGKAHSLVIGKSVRKRVDIDLQDTPYASLISRQHSVLNKGKDGWYLEDLGSENGTGIKKYIDNRKLKIGNKPVKVQSGDIIYLSKTKLLLK